MKKQYKIAVMLIAFGAIGCGNANESKTKESDQTGTEVTSSVERSTSDPMANKGIGPVSHVELGELDATLAQQGQELFESKCQACHKMGKRFVGPDLTGVVDRRSPEWVMNMILNPEVMVKEDPIAKELLAEYISPMANQSLTEEEARAILEYFRTNN